MNQTRSIYVTQLSRPQADKLRQLLDEQQWQIEPAPHAHWRASREKTVIIAYRSGKLVVQGRGTADAVQFLIEPKILEEARFGYEHTLAEAENPQMFEPHIGVDESGKGDYFGPLVIAAVYVDQKIARELLVMGVQDSKKIGSDRKITSLSEQIKKIVFPYYSVIPIGPEAYNRLYRKIANLNRLLGWGHARALENVLDKVPDCPRAISDKFGHESSIRNALQSRGKQIKLIQIPRAEADLAVAAASILARADFVKRLQELSTRTGLQLPKGAGPPVLAAARKIVSEQGANRLATIAKLHFKTTGKATQ